MTTIAGSWIGGGANQAAMKEVFAVDANLFGQFVAVDVIVAYFWMAILLYFAPRAKAFDRWTGADTSAIEDLKQRIADYQAEHEIGRAHVCTPVTNDHLVCRLLPVKK